MGDEQGSCPGKNQRRKGGHSTHILQIHHNITTRVVLLQAPVNTSQRAPETAPTCARYEALFGEPPPTSSPITGQIQVPKPREPRKFTATHPLTWSTRPATTTPSPPAYSIAHPSPRLISLVPFPPPAATATRRPQPWCTFARTSYPSSTNTNTRASTTVLSRDMSSSLSIHMSLSSAFLCGWRKFSQRVQNCRMCANVNRPNLVSLPRLARRPGRFIPL